MVAAVLSFSVPTQAAPDLGFAEQDGGQPGAFLDFAASARSMGMGRAHVGVADDASAMYWNPSGLAQVQRKDIVTSYSTLYEETTYGVFNYAQPTIDLGTFGIGLVSLRSDNYDKRDDNGFQDGSFDTSEMAFMLSHGIEVNNRWSVGSTFKVIREDVETYSGTGYGLDGGAMYRASDYLKFGLMLRNVLGPRIELKKETERHPFAMRVGTEWQALKKLMVAVDLDKTTGRSLKPYIGGEWTMNKMLALRVGLNENELSTGFGFKFNDWGLDYAFGFHDSVGGVKDLGSSHRFGLHLNFGKRVFEEEASQRWQKKGQSNLVELQQKMTDWDGRMDDSLARLLTSTKQVIRRQGYLKPEHLYAAQGYISYFQGEYERSVQSLGESLVLDPQNTALAANLEQARAQMTVERTREIVAQELKHMKDLYEKADWKATVKSCEKVLSFLPDNVEALSYMEDAKKHINEPIEREMRIAKMKFDRAEYLDAIKSLQKVQVMDPENKEAKNYMAQSIAALEKQANVMIPEPTPTASPSGEPVYEIERNTEESRALYIKGLSLYSQGKLRDAAEAWGEAVRYDSTNTLARTAYSRAKSELAETR